MLETIPHEPACPANADPVIPERQPLSHRLCHTLGRAGLAAIGVSLILATASEPIMPVAHAQAGLVKNVDDNVPAPAPVPVATAPSAPVAETYTPAVGIATGSWDNDGLGYHTLFKDIAAEGMTEVRLNLMGLPEMRAEVANAISNNVQPIISLPLNLSPEAAAQVAKQLPQVNRFVVGNEVNSPLFSDLSPQQYVDYLYQVYNDIHAARPGVEVSGFALASGYLPLRYFAQAVQYADATYGSLPMDSLDIHLYRTLPKDLWMINAYQQLYGGPIHIGELGWIVNDPNQAGSVSLTEQASNEATFYTDMTQDPQIRSFDFFKYRANSADPFDTANVAQDGTFRPAYYTLQVLLLTANDSAAEAQSADRQHNPSRTLSRRQPLHLPDRYLATIADSRTRQHCDSNYLQQPSAKPVCSGKSWGGQPAPVSALARERMNAPERRPVQRSRLLLPTHPQ